MAVRPLFELFSSSAAPATKGVLEGGYGDVSCKAVRLRVSANSVTRCHDIGSHATMLQRD